MRQFIDIVETNLFELTPYRGSEELAALKTATDRWSTHQGVNRSLMQGFMEKLAEKGYRPLGNGINGAVLGVPGADYVVKVFYADPAYLAFLDFVLANPDNPHLPRVRGKVMKIEGKYHLVRMEKLDHIGPKLAQVAGQLEVFAMSKRTPAEFIMMNQKNIERGYEFARLSAEAFDRFPMLLPTIAKLREIAPGELDIHQQNIMERPDGTIVIIDPFYQKPFKPIQEDLDPDMDDEPDYSDLKPSAAIIALKPLLVKVAQEQYDRWTIQDGDEIGFQDEFAGGGICHLIADEISTILNSAGIGCATVSSNNEVHVYCVAQCQDGIFEVDVPYRIYETGGGYNWTRIEGVVFDDSDIVVSRLDIDPGAMDQYCDC